MYFLLSNIIFTFETSNKIIHKTLKSMQTLIVLPNEVNELAAKVSANKQEEVQTVLQQIFTGTADWEKQVDSIEVKDINDKMSIELAETARKNAKTARLNAAKIFDAKREQVQQIKSEFDLEDKLWLKAKQVMELKFKAIEEKAEWKANFVKRHEAEQKELLTQNRILQATKYAQINRIEFENMSNESFESFLSGLQTTYENRIAAEQKAESERIAKEKADAEQREQQRLENEKLKFDADKREREIALERKENEERLAKEQAKAKAETDRIAAENKAILDAQRKETDRIATELQAKKDAEIAAENEKVEKELQDKKAAENLAKAPIKQQLTIWVQSFELPITEIEHEKTILIQEKFIGFLAWAKKEIESI